MALLKDHLIAHYKLNDNLATDVIIDETGNHNGTVKDPGGTATSEFHSVAGKILRAQEFDGIDDYIDLPNNAALNFSMQNQAFSIGVCIKTGNQGTIVSKAVDLAIERQYQIYLNVSGKISVYLGGTLTTWSTADLGNDVWHYIVLTVPAAAGGAKCYVDGVEITLRGPGVGAIGPEMNPDQSVNIGARTDGSYLFDGLIDNIMFFNKVLTPNDVRALYNSGRGTEIIPIGIENQLSRTGHRFSSFPEN